MSMRRCAMNRRYLSLFFGLLLITSILTPQGGAQDGIRFEAPKDEVKKKKAAPSVAPNPATVEVLNRQSAKLDSLTDGDAVKLKVSLDRPADLASVAAFKFADDGRQIATCIIAAGSQSCETPLALALGWHWGKDAKGQSEREIRAETADAGLPDTMKFSGAAKLRVSARPVVLVHGLASNAATWAEYTKQDGYLAAADLRGFAVGDGQVEGAMFTGDPSQPLKQTK